MADIHIERKHQLGLDEARRVADRWQEEVAKKLDIAFTVVRGEAADTVEFARSGVTGALQVEPDRFVLNARLGLLLGAFKDKIQAEIERNFDELLSSSAATQPGAGRAA